MNVLVVGGAGYIGMAVSHLLEQAGHGVVRYDNLSQASEPGSLGVFVRGELADTERLLSVMKEHEISVVVHLAGKISVSESVEHPLEYWANNVGGTLSLVEAMEMAGVQLLVFSSTAAVYGEPQFMPLTEDHPINPINPYGHTKWVVEQLLSDLASAGQLRYVALRYFNAAGAIPGLLGERHKPEQHLIPNVVRAALGGPPVKIYGSDYATHDGTAVRDYVHIHDLADAHVKALDYLERGGDSVAMNLANAKGYSVLEVLAATERVIGGLIPCQYAPRRLGDPARLIGDSTKARKVLGWAPKFEGLDEIVASAVAWHRQERK